MKATLPFSRESFKAGAGLEHELLSFVSTFIVIFLSGLLKWGLLMAAFKVLCKVLWKGKCFISSFSASEPFTN